MVEEVGVLYEYIIQIETKKMTQKELNEVITSLSDSGFVIFQVLKKNTV